MKLPIIVAMTFGAFAGVLELSSYEPQVITLDARPEALIVGASLLVLASVLRHRLTSSAK